MWCDVDIIKVSSTSTVTMLGLILSDLHNSKNLLAPFVRIGHLPSPMFIATLRMEFVLAIYYTLGQQPNMLQQL